MFAAHFNGLTRFWQDLLLLSYVSQGPGWTRVTTLECLCQWRRLPQALNSQTMSQSIFVQKANMQISGRGKLVSLKLQYLRSETWTLRTGRDLFALSNGNLTHLLKIGINPVFSSWHLTMNYCFLFSPQCLPIKSILNEFQTGPSF